MWKYTLWVRILILKHNVLYSWITELELRVRQRNILSSSVTELWEAIWWHCHFRVHIIETLYKVMKFDLLFSQWLLLLLLLLLLNHYWLLHKILLLIKWLIPHWHYRWLPLVRLLLLVGILEVRSLVLVQHKRGLLVLLWK